MLRVPLHAIFKRDLDICILKKNIFSMHQMRLVKGKVMHFFFLGFLKTWMSVFFTENKNLIMLVLNSKLSHGFLETFLNIINFHQFFSWWFMYF